MIIELPRSKGMGGNCDGEVEGGRNNRGNSGFGVAIATEVSKVPTVMGLRSWK